MKLQENKFFLSTWFWGIIPSFLIFLFIKDPGGRYSVAVDNKSTIQSVQEVFVDLNGDGVTELVHAKHGPPLNNFPIMDNENNHFDQWNLPDELTPEISTLYFGNYDEDTYTEIYVFTTRADSIFLNVNEFFDPNGLHLQRKFITTVNPVDGHINSTLKHLGFSDQNNDGKLEFYFRISTGFGLWPRLCYYYDLENQQLKSSPFTGINFNHPIMEDIDGDSLPEIFSNNMTAAGNYNTPTPFTDYSAWLMVLNTRLDFKFPPVEFPGFGGSLDIFSVNKNLLVVYNFQGVDKPLRKPGVMLYSPQGKLVKEKPFSELGIESRIQATVLQTKKQNQIVLLGKSLLLLNDQIELVKKEEIQFESAYYSHQYDLNNDGQKELLLYSSDEKKMIIYNSDLEEYGSLPMDVPDYDWQLSQMITKTGETKCFIKSGNRAYFLQLIENKYYWVQYLIYPAIYFGFVLFIGLVKKINSAQVVKRESQKRKLQTLQLQSIKGQLDPHFTFNALNSVAALMYLDDRKTAYDHLNKFTRLIRQMLNDAERVYRTVEEELEFVEVYLGLEKLRFGDKFDYEIQVSEGVTLKEQVPVLCIQTFVENAIKHGLNNKSSGGLLKITIRRVGSDLYLAIEDNGIGRAKAAQLSNSTGKGLRLNREFYDILNQTNINPIRHNLTDLYDDDGQASGTRAEVWVPVKLYDPKF